MVILCVALFLIESSLKWLRQWSYPFKKNCRCLGGVFSDGELKEDRERTEEEERGRRETGGGGGQEMTETNASALTAVPHFRTDRHTNEDHKSNQSLQD